MSVRRSFDPSLRSSSSGKTSFTLPSRTLTLSHTYIGRSVVSQPLTEVVDEDVDEVREEVAVRDE